MDITCLTYNIHKAIGNDGNFNTERIARVCENERADIIALQEVDDGVPRSRHKNLAAELGERLGFHWRLGINVELKIGGYGNAILSRWPLGESRNLDLTWTIKKKRGCLSGIIETPFGPVFVMNFHLGLSRIERHFQIKNMLESEWLGANRSLPVIALGDSNERTRYMDIFMNISGFRNAAGKLKRKFKTWPSFAPIWNLDKIFYNVRLTARHYEVVRNPLTRMASDHFPVKAILGIQKGS